ncbi:MAG: M23 family metallopeptidase [Salinibacterium sp.]|nr:M23 family metallopeptidase [Salinibacterium sp.]
MLRFLTLVILVLLAPGPASIAPATSSSALIRPLELHSPTPQSPRPQWFWPVDTPSVVVRPFIAPATPYSRGHRGVDLAAEAGTAYAPADGIVHFAGVVVNRPVLSLRHPGGLISSYEPVESALVEGDAVARGDPIGTVVAGHCSKPCLHFGVRLNGEYVSPMLYLGGIEASVLLPTRR